MQHLHRAPKKRYLGRKTLAVAAVGALVPLVSMIPANAGGEVTVHQDSSILDCATNTRANGHNEIIERGNAQFMHVFTTDNSSLAKAACDITIPDDTIAGVGLPDMDWSFKQWTAPYQLIAPGVQIVGGSDQGAFRLVYETIYGNDLWAANESAPDVKIAAPSCDGDPDALTNPAAHCIGGSGSYYHGTPAEWDAALTNNVVNKIGWSLGSGVHGDGYIHDIAYGDGNDIDFAVGSEPPPADTPVAPHVVDNSTTACRQVNIDVTLPEPASGTFYDPATINYRVMVGGKLQDKGTFSAGDEYTAVRTFSKTRGSVKYKVFESETGYANILVSQGTIDRNCTLV
jgi:hypothetical protein